MTRMMLAAAALLSACVDPADLYTVHATPDPTEVIAREDVTYDFHVHTSDDHEVVEGATLTVTPWMPAHGHGIDDEVVVVELGEGHYEATFQFSMPGEWELQIDIDGDAGVGEVVVTQTVGGEMMGGMDDTGMDSGMGHMSGH